MPNRRQLILGAGGIVAALGGTLALGAWRSRDAAQVPAENPDLPRDLSRMGWQLTDHRGQRIGPGDWLGRPAIVFFGFTWCPDVCPTTLMNITTWLEELGADADRLTVALITVDPERDSPAVLAEYLGAFDPRIAGLTGSAGDIARAAADFRVQYKKVPGEGDDYTMSHTAGVFLFGPDGRFANIIDFHEDPKFAVPKIRRILT